MIANTHQFDWNAIKLRLRESEAAMERNWAPTEQKRTNVYRRRLVDYARRDASATDRSKARPMLVFGLGQERYGIDLSTLVSVFPLVKCTPVPAAPRELLGMINVGGEIRGVMDTACLLELPPSPDRYSGHVALVRQAEIEIALRVDRVEAIEDVCLETLVTLEQSGPGQAMRYVEGVTPGRLIVLNVRQLLSHPVFTSNAIEQEGD